jgi:hypothetical protein
MSSSSDQSSPVFFHGETAPSGQEPPNSRGFTITLSQTHPLGRIPLDEWSARRRDLYLTTHDTHKRQTSIPSAGFEPAILGSERPQTHTLDRAATEIDQFSHSLYRINKYIADQNGCVI